MYATIARRCATGMGTPAELERAGRALSALVCGLPGFVAYVALEDEDGGIASISIFENRASMEEANQRMAAWQAGGTGAPSPCRLQLVSGEVIAQKGL